ncbi:MAG: FAD binding domain-containing protein [Burkholderiaceae bacterium]|nr:FAD binding domain-containing protein [Burkholderiaceae bacterium]
MYPFSYQRADTLSATVAALAADPDAKAIAGGMTLIPSMKHRLAAPGRLIDITRLAELQGIDAEDGWLRIGAATRHRDVASETVAAHIPALARLAHTIGDPQVRARGTLGGSVANADPAADYPAALLALAAIVVTDRREITADDFFVDMFTTALEPDELIRSIRFRIPRRAAYAKFHHPASGYAMTGVCVAELDGAVRVGVTGAAPVPFRWQAAEEALSPTPTSAGLEGLSYPPDGLNADMHAPAEYRAHLVAVMTRRALGAMENDQ